MNKLIPAALALATVLATAPSASAEASRSSVVQVRVAYRSADLATSQGASKLLRRIEGLALRMCRSGPHSRLARPVASEIWACQQKAVSRAVTELDAPLVTAAYADRRLAKLAAR